MPMKFTGMAKKKKSLPKDDLIDQLLDDVNDIAADESLEDMPSSPDIPIGLNEGTRALVGAEENPWASLQGDFPSEQPLEYSEPVAESDSSPLGEFGGPDGMSTGVYQGPSADGGGFQSLDDLNEQPSPKVSFESSEGFEQEATRPLSSARAAGEDRTMSIAHVPPATRTGDHEATVAADGFANRRLSKGDPQEKVVIGSLRGARSGNVHTSMDASLQQAENLKIAQQRILDLEKENDRLRQENEEVSSAADIIRSRLEELSARITAQEREKAELQEAAQNEMMILKGNLHYKESEVAKARLKIDELEVRLRSDFKKIRIKERELENRLELARAEKSALVRAKDENILELKRKIDQQQSEIDNYREKLLELNKTIEANQEQFKRTVRALRLALSNLEATDDNVVPLKKAE